MKIRMMLVIFCVLVFTSATFAQQIKNGSFEDGRLRTSFGQTVLAGSTDITNWTVVFGNVDYGTLFEASDGSRSIDLNGYFQRGAISQRIWTVPGLDYYVKFDMSGNPDGGPTLKVLKVSAHEQYPFGFSYSTNGSTGCVISYCGTPTTRDNMKYVPEVYHFTAIAYSTEIKFESMIEGAYGPVIDNVRVEPAGSSSAYQYVADTPDEMVDALKKTIELLPGLNDPYNGDVGTNNSMTAKLNSAINALKAGDIQGARESLQSFISFVRAQKGKKIPQPEANELIILAGEILKALK